MEGYRYDGNGNVIEDEEGWVYEYDAENKIIRAERGGEEIRYVYNGEGERVRKIKGGEEIRYLIDKENPTGYSQVIEERGSGGEVKRRYVYGYDLISMTDVSTNKTYYYVYYGIASVGVAIGMAGILAGIAENVWADIGVKSKEKIIKRLIQYFYDASKETGIDIDVLGSLAWSESANWKLGYWDRNAGPDVGIMQLHYKGAPKEDRENILSGAKILKQKKEIYEEVRKRGYFKKPRKIELRIVLTEEEIKDEWLVPVWMYKSNLTPLGLRLARIWNKEIYKQWPDVKGNYRTSMILRKLWKKQNEFLIK